MNGKTRNTRRPLYKQMPKTNHRGMTGFFNRLYTGETGKPVDVEVETVRNTPDTVIRHNIQNISDFSPMDFYFPFAILVIIFVMRFFGMFGFVSIMLLVILVKDLFKRVNRRPSGPRATGLCDPYKPGDWWRALGIYAVSAPFLIGAGILNRHIIDSLFPSPEPQFPSAAPAFEFDDGHADSDQPDLDFDDEYMDMDFHGLESGDDYAVSDMPAFEMGSEYTAPGFMTGLLAAGLLLILLYFIEIVIFAPLTEEIWFRGIGLASFMKKTGSPMHAVIVTSVIFGILHGPGSVLFATLFGFVMALIRFRTGSLYCCMAMHALHNFLVLVVGIYLAMTGGPNILY